jgi:hypothetical protein
MSIVSTSGLSRVRGRLTLVLGDEILEEAYVVDTVLVRSGVDWVSMVDSFGIDDLRILRAVTTIVREVSSKLSMRLIVIFGCVLCSFPS